MIKDISRRFFVKAALLAGGVLAIPKMAWSYFVSAMQTRTVETRHFTFHPEDGTIQWNNGARAREPYRLVVEGLVEQPRQFSYQALKAMPQVSQMSDFHCVEGWSVKDLNWGGIRLSEVVKAAGGLEKGARYAVFHSLGKTQELRGGVDHYVESLPVDELLDPAKKCLLALSLDGKPLTYDRGSPLRVVSPFHLGYKGAKFVTKIVLSDREVQGWWTVAAGYPVDAPVPTRRLRK